MNIIEIKESKEENLIVDFSLLHKKNTDLYEIYINNDSYGKLNRGDLRHLIELLDYNPYESPEIILNGAKIGYIDNYVTSELVEYIDKVIHKEC